MSGKVLFICGIHTSQLHASYMTLQNLRTDYQKLIMHACFPSYISVTYQLHASYTVSLCQIKEYSYTAMLHLGFPLLLILPPMYLL